MYPSGYLRVAEQLCKFGPQPFDSWNFGPGPASTRTVAEFAELTFRLWGRPDAMKFPADRDGPHEASLARFLRAVTHLPKTFKKLSLAPTRKYSDGPIKWSWALCTCKNVPRAAVTRSRGDQQIEA